ncbi:PREDICTED: receptor-type tyrosine-protein phosphatase alpha-like [Gekko japonicus]|uniref:protein-tyrosine-phosphatase n=1 Tax=Gekko japonicus TaxID=146911 RepID=A0ABM1KNC8_GEKJA|nr:PREDICTED: receptor-type tyrosine-protein phosphatase alpha-like [Gekko japonicus]
MNEEKGMHICKVLPTVGVPSSTSALRTVKTQPATGKPTSLPSMNVTSPTVPPPVAAGHTTPAATELPPTTTVSTSGTEATTVRVPVPPSLLPNVTSPSSYGITTGTDGVPTEANVTGVLTTLKAFGTSGEITKGPGKPLYFAFSLSFSPIPVSQGVLDKLEEEINRRMADDNKLFREEFNALPACPIQATCEAASKEENKEKNRYVNILPYDHSRVHLTPLEGVPDSDYINASFINGYQEKNKFIAAQGPKEETVNDFWRMIWEQNTATIVMVTNLKERKECKCAQYWPDQGCWTYGNIRVSVEDVTVLVDYTVRKFCIQQVGDVTNKKPQRLVTQFHFTSWPDFGVPFTPIGMLKFLKKVKTCNPQYAGAIVVHCSAGVGRTGTFIVIDAMLDMMLTERKVDVYGFVSRIRAQRCQMVQTDMQYVFIYQALLEHYLYGDTELEVTSLEIHLQKIYNKVPGTSTNGLEEEFKKLTSIKIQNDKMRTGNLPANMKKNRVLQIIPYEFNRVIIPVKRGEENTDYVNASFIDEKCAQYWPSDGSVSYGDITVELKKEEECESYTVRDLLVANTRENKIRQIRQFHFHGWPEVGIPSDGKGMINIIAAVQKQQQQSGNHPITVHCSAGAGRTGTFCALGTVLERVKAEGILDVFQTVKSLRLQRPHMVQTLEQYEFCYKVVQEYIDAFSDYANFK